MSFIKWANTARQLGIDWTLETMVNESLISRARNTLTAKFLDMPDLMNFYHIQLFIQPFSTNQSGVLPQLEF
jgi:hypothetical protein